MVRWRVRLGEVGRKGRGPFSTPGGWGKDRRRECIKLVRLGWVRGHKWGEGDPETSQGAGDCGGRERARQAGPGLVWPDEGMEGDSVGGRRGGGRRWALAQRGAGSSERGGGARELGRRRVWCGPIKRAEGGGTRRRSVVGTGPRHVAKRLL